MINATNSTIVQLCTDIAKKDGAEVGFQLLWTPHSLWFILPLIIILIVGASTGNLKKGSFYGMLFGVAVAEIIGFFLWTFGLTGGFA